MEKKLPVEVLQEIELKAVHEAALQFHPVYSPDQNTACRICYRNGAKEYATKLQEAEENHKRLIKDILFIEEQKRDVLARWHEAAKPLLEKVLRRHEGGLLPDRLLYLEIKKFLYGE